MKTRLPVRDLSATHEGYRSPAFQVVGRYGQGIGDALLGAKRSHEDALALARKMARRARYQEIVIQ